MVLGLNIYFRTFTINLPQLKKQAQANIENKIQQEAIQEIDQRFSEFNQLAKDLLVRTLIKENKREKKQAIKKQIEEEYNKLKSEYQDSQGQTYLMELDCWHWARYVDNVLRLGHPGDKVVEGKQFDSLMLAPLGSYLPWNQFLFYFSAFLYKAFCLIRPLPLYTFLFYLPLFFITIFIIILLLFSFQGGGNLSAIVTCLFVGLAPVFLIYSSAGWFDMDILNLLFPILIVWFYLLANESISYKRRFFWICFSSFWLGLFSFTWIGWWFILLIIIIYEIYSLLNLIFVYFQYKEKNPKLFKQHIFSFLFFVLLSFFWVVIFSGLEPWKVLYSQVKEVLILNKPLTASLWPNILSTVRELRKANLQQIVNLSGGILLFTFLLFSILALFLLSRHNQRYTAFQREAITIMVIWFFSLFFACFRGERFVNFLVIPLGMFLGWFLNTVFKYLRNKKKRWLIGLLIMLILVFSDTMIMRANKMANTLFPAMNDTWYQTLIKIKETTPLNTIVNSWWDFGDWFKTVSKRRVIFDGQSQNTPQAYWMAKVLVTQNEEEAIRILRMLNNGGNQAFEIINEKLKEPFKSIFLLKKLISSEPQIAKENLVKFLPNTTGEKVMKLLFEQPPRAFFLVDYTMPLKMNTISYLGNWDFAKLYLTKNIKRKAKKEIIDYLSSLDINSQKAERLYQEVLLISNKDWENWTSQRVNFYSGLIEGQKKNGTILFDNGLIYNPKEQTIYLFVPWEAKYKIPKSLFIFTQDKLEEITYPNNDLDFSILLLKNQEEYQAVMLDRQLVNSLFVRLYFLNGLGLKHFQPFIEEKDSRGSIRVFEIIWD